MYKIAICEDDRAYIEKLKELIVRTNLVDAGLLQFHEFYSGEQIFIYPELDFDLIIMDIQMNKMDGYETAMSLRRQDRDFLLVFCSGVVQPLPKFFKANAYRYLEKRNSDEVMLEEMKEIIAEMVSRKTHPFLMCKYGPGKEQIRVYPHSVLYVSILHAACQLFACGKLKERYPTETLRIKMNLNQVAEIFNESCGFVRIHNSYIVNMAYIEKTIDHAVVLTDGIILNIARSREKHFQKVFAKYMASKYKG